MTSGHGRGFHPSIHPSISRRDVPALYRRQQLVTKCVEITRPGAKIRRSKLKISLSKSSHPFLFPLHWPPSRARDLHRTPVLVLSAVRKPSAQGLCKPDLRPWLPRLLLRASRKYFRFAKISLSRPKLRPLNNFRDRRYERDDLDGHDTRILERATEGGREMRVRG